MRSPIPADIKPENIVAIIDIQEETHGHALDLSPLQTCVQHLPTADYSVVGLENIVAIERKEIGDLLQCLGNERERFQKCLQRMLAYPVRALVIEATLDQIERGDWPVFKGKKSEITPASAIGSLLSWMNMGIPVLFAGDHARAGKYVARMLLLAARRRWRENRAILAILDEPKNE